MTRLLCPACGARVRETAPIMAERYGCAGHGGGEPGCGWSGDHPIALADSRTIKRWCREEDVDREVEGELADLERDRISLRDVDCDPDAARRARIRGAMPEGERTVAPHPVERAGRDD